MTKVKTILSTITGLAIIGGASALKHKKPGVNALYTLYQFEALQTAQSCDKFITLGTSDLGPARNREYYYITTTAPVVDSNSDFGYNGDNCTYKYYTIYI